MEVGPRRLPPVMPLAAPSDTRVLVVAAMPTTPTASLSEVFDRIDGAKYTMWFKPRHGRCAVHSGAGLPELTEAPTGDDLSRNDISVVILDNINPDWLPEDFYTSLKQRVAEGLTGVLVQGYPPFALGEGAGCLCGVQAPGPRTAAPRWWHALDARTRRA